VTKIIAPLADVPPAGTPFDATPPIGPGAAVRRAGGLAPCGLVRNLP